MGKTGKWIRGFLTGKQKEKDLKQEKCQSDHHHLPSLVVTENPTTPVIFPPITPKEKRRWSFRRSSASAASAPKDLSNSEGTTPGTVTFFDGENEQNKHAMAVAAATAAAADAAVEAAQAAAVMIRLASAANGRSDAVEEAAATKIQAVFRSYLARKALRALRGLVKLQALVRGHLVRKQAKATLRCMQALLNVQAKVRAQRIMLAEDGRPPYHRQSPHRRSIQDNKNRYVYQDPDRGQEENIKIVEMDFSEPKVNSRNRKSYSNYSQIENGEPRFSEYYPVNHSYSKQDGYQISPAPSALTDMSPRLCCGHFEEYNSFNTAEISPQCFSAVSKKPPSEYAESLNYDYSFYPNYMANTESSRAKARSQSAPKCRPDSYERQPSRRKLPLEGRNVPRSVRMQRSSSNVGSTIQGYQYPWSIKLGRSTVSVKDSECGSTSTVLTNTNYCRSLAGYELQRNGIKY